MPRIVICDSSPLRYLVLIGEADLLARLYAQVVIPEAVAEELNQSSTPEVVREWMADRPDWIQVMPSTGGPAVVRSDLDLGEHEAILLALRLKADLVIMDDREGVTEARRLGLAVTGTLGVLKRGAELGLIKLPPVITRLRQTNFRVDPALLDRLLTEDAQKLGN
ncbi:MAG TPA: DUF3368 domain-containing protein [Bryobacteraceae bacterium]|nr:DUF3368 domain-containing protein [Bryobacteraceae bacterium]